MSTSAAGEQSSSALGSDRSGADIGQAVDAHTLRTPIMVQPESGGEPVCNGILFNFWNTQNRPTALDARLAVLAVERAAAIVHDERMSTRSDQHGSEQPQLERAKERGRVFASTIGTIMADYGVDAAQAFTILTARRT